MRLHESVEVNVNLSIIGRERGKIIVRRDGHNIWLDLGREFLAELLTLSAFNPDTPERDDRIKYFGLGIGGSRQFMNPFPAAIETAYGPRSVAQTDEDATLTQLESPVRLSGGITGAVEPGDLWLGAVQAPVVHPVATDAEFRRLFTANELNYGPFESVPISEVGMFTSAADPSTNANIMVAYDTFDTISKTSALELEVVWTIKF